LQQHPPVPWVKPVESGWYGHGNSPLGDNSPGNSETPMVDFPLQGWDSWGYNQLVKSTVVNGCASIAKSSHRLVKEQSPSERPEQHHPPGSRDSAVYYGIPPKWPFQGEHDDQLSEGTQFSDHFR
jgi:hypothetical protein